MAVKGLPAVTPFHVNLRQRGNPLWHVISPKCLSDDGVLWRENEAGGIELERVFVDSRAKVENESFSIVQEVDYFGVLCFLNRRY